MNPIMVTVEINGKYYDGPMEISNIRIKPHNTKSDSLLVNLGKSPTFTIRKTSTITLKFEEKNNETGQ